MKPLTVWLEDGYCSITVANHQLITVIRFITKNYTYSWKDFTIRFYLTLHACEILFSEKKIHASFVAKPNKALDSSPPKAGSEVEKDCSPGAEWKRWRLVTGDWWEMSNSLTHVVKRPAPDGEQQVLILILIEFLDHIRSTTIMYEVRSPEFFQVNMSLR